MGAAKADTHTASARRGRRLGTTLFRPQPLVSPRGYGEARSVHGCEWRTSLVARPRLQYFIPAHSLPPTRCLPPLDARQAPGQLALGRRGVDERLLRCRFAVVVLELRPVGAHVQVWRGAFQHKHGTKKGTAHMVSTCVGPPHPVGARPCPPIPPPRVPHTLSPAARRPSGGQGCPLPG